MMVAYNKKIVYWDITQWYIIKGAKKARNLKLGQFGKQYGIIHDYGPEYICYISQKLSVIGHTEEVGL